MKHHLLRLSWLMLLLPIFSPVNSQLCSSSAALSGTSFTDNNATGSFAFHTLAGAESSDNTRAIASAIITVLNGNTHVLEAKGFGFSIPEAAGICGIQVDIEKSASSISLFATVKDQSIRLLKAGVAIGNNYATSSNWSSTDHSETYGGSNDTWGTDWTPADLNDPGFGVAFSAHIKALIALLPSARIDQIRVTVYYNVILAASNIKFTAAAVPPHRALLQWSIEPGNEILKINVQRKANNADWTTLYTENNPGYANAAPHQFNDDNTGADIALYRLQMIMVPGNVVYSKTIPVKSWSMDKGSTLYPNPAGDVCYIKGISAEKNVTCIGSNGRMFRLPLQKAGSDVYRMNLQRLQPGMYRVRAGERWLCFLKY